MTHIITHKQRIIANHYRNLSTEDFMIYECPECERETEIEKCWTCDPERGE
jgi:recombinational DNA repair protein RecR